MGVIHKLKPEVKDFILAQKSNNPTLSCRKLTTLVLNNFKIELSKSSINMIIKEAGLSAPIGRSPKKKRHHIVMPRLPVLLEDASNKKAEQEETAKKVQEEQRAKETEAARIKEEEKARKAEEERIVQEAKKKAEEEAEKAKAEAEERAKKEAEKEALRKKEEEEKLAREAEEKARLEEEKSKAEAEAARKTDEKRKRQEEEIKKEAEEKARKAEEDRLAQEAKKKAEEAKSTKEAEEKAQLEKEKKSQEETAKKVQEEQRAKETEAARIKEEEKARKAEEERIVQEAKKKAEEEAEKEILQPEQAKAIVAFNVDRFPQIDNTGIILLKAADSIIGASQNIAAAIKSRLARVDSNFNTMVENLIYLPLLKGKIEQPILDKLAACLNEIENIKVMNLDILRTITLSLQEVRCIRVILSDGENLYIDGQMYSVWSSPHIPYDFVSPIHNLKKYINKYFNEGQPLVLFNAPGYDMPSPGFFSLLKAFEAQSSSISNMILYGNKFNELEVIPSSPNKKRSLIFGIWPWQFIECRKVKSIGQFRRLHLEVQNSDFYIADIEMNLSHPRLGKQVTLNGCAVKASLNEKTRLVILSNIAPGDKSSEELAITYLNHWPNLEEAFQDYSHKVELFTYAANSQRFFSAEKLNPQLDHVLSVEELLRNYLLALDAYVRWYLLPSGYADKEMMLAKERFYDLSVQLTKNNESCLASFVLPSEYSFGKDLGYLCRRLNEKEITFSDGVKLYFK